MKPHLRFLYFFVLSTCLKVRLFFFYPTTKVGMQNGSSVGACCTHVFAIFGADSYAQLHLLTKISASELSRKLIKSALLVGYAVCGPAKKRFPGHQQDLHFTSCSGGFSMVTICPSSIPGGSCLRPAGAFCCLFPTLSPPSPTRKWNGLHLSLQERGGSLFVKPSRPPPAETAAVSIVPGGGGGGGS